MDRQAARPVPPDVKVGGPLGKAPTPNVVCAGSSASNFLGVRTTSPHEGDEPLPT